MCYYLNKGVITINDRIKQIRNLANLTQTEFAEKIGLTKNYISLLENGQRAPSERTINCICREFGVSETWLYTGAGEPYVKKSREAEMGDLLKTLLRDSSESFRTRLITTLLRFDPNGTEWEVLERIYKSVAKEKETDPE